MSEQTITTAQKEPIDNRLSLRLEENIAERFAAVVEASRRTKTSIIEECLENGLPKFEKRHGIVPRTLKKAA